MSNFSSANHKLFPFNPFGSNRHSGNNCKKKSEISNALAYEKLIFDPTILYKPGESLWKKLLIT